MDTSNFLMCCYINKNTATLRQKLLRIGHIAKQQTEDGWNLVCENGTFQTGRFLYGREKIKFIDCGLREKLFLALAALRADSDKNQYFVAHKPIIISKTITDDIKCIYPGEFFLCEEDNASVYSKRGIRLPGEDNVFFHKATAMELIKYFSKFD